LLIPESFEESSVAAAEVASVDPVSDEETALVVFVMVSSHAASVLESVPFTDSIDIRCCSVAAGLSGRE
jgi:hypothetical protein